MAKNEYAHVPVMLNEVLAGLAVRPEGIYVDCTFGRGGHSLAILDQLDDQGRLYVFDRDLQAIEMAKSLASQDSRIKFFHSKFSNLRNKLESSGLAGSVDGILFDLGISSPQIDNAERGFSFMLQGKLDMRMDTTSGISAATWINEASIDEITHVLKVYGEEKFARRIARNISASRAEEPILTTHKLSEIVCSAIPVREKKKHPATRTFQAIRIFLNNELDELATGLLQAFELLGINGRLAVISFHSLEDRIVKRFMREFSKNDPYPTDIPVTSDMVEPQLKLIGKVHKPEVSEINANPRARSARLRIAEKLKA